MQNKGFWRRWSLKLARFAGISLFLAALSLVTGTASASANNTLSGTFKDSLGNPVPGASVYLVTGTGATTTGTVTSTGTYSVSVPAGTYTLGFSTNSVVTASATIPPGEFFSSSGHSVNLTAGNITQDFAMNLAPISVTVLDQFGMPLSNNRICAQASGGTADMGPAAGTFSSVTLRPAQYSACRPITDTLGHATIYLPVGMTISQLIAVPATGSAFATFNIGTITGSASVTIQQPATRTFSGVFRDGVGNPVKGLIMSITSPVAGANTGVITGTDGAFNLSLPAYGYQLGVTCCQTGTNPFPAIPSGNFSTSGTVPVDLTAGNITSDLSFDLAPLTVTVLMADGTPAANTALNVAGSGTIALNPLGQIAATLGVYGSTSDAAPYEPITNSSGQAVVWVPKNMTLTTIEAILPLSNPTFTDSRPGYDSPVSLNITGPASATVQLPTLRSFQGIFRDGLGQPVNGATVNLVGTTQSWTIHSDSTGHFFTYVTPNTYKMNVSLSRANAPTAAIPQTLNTSLTPQNVNLSTASINQDISVDLAPVTVTVKNVNGDLVPNSPVVATASTGTITVIPYGTVGGSYGGSVSSVGVPKTDSTGTVVLYLPKGMPANLTAYTGTTPLVAGSITSPITGPTSITLQQFYTYSGTFRDGLGQVLAGVDVQLKSTSSGATYTSRTTSTGTFSVSTLAGSYIVSASLDKANTTATTAPPGVFSTNFTGPSVTLNGNVSQNLSLPEAAVTVTVKDRNGNLAANIPVSATGTGTTTLYTGGNFTNSTVTPPSTTTSLPKTNASGQATFYLPTGLSYSKITAYFSGGNVDYTTLGQLNGATSLTIQQPAISTLSGRVLDGAAQAIAGVSVQIVDPNNHATVIAATTTNSTGNYSATVTAGTYDVLFTPTGDTYLPTSQTGVNLANDATLNITLAQAAHTFSGTLKDRGGLGIAGARITLHNTGGQNPAATTGLDGSFSIQANPAVYSLTITGTRAAAPLAIVPADFSLSGGSFDLSADISQNFVINGVVTTFTTTNAVGGGAIGHVALSTSAGTTTTLYAGSGAYSGSSNEQVTTNASGIATVVLLSGSTYTTVATPPTGSGVIATTFPATGPVTTDANRELALTADIKHFTGTFSDQAGTAIAGANVRLTGPLGDYSTTTGSTGHFDVPAAAGSYGLSVGGNRPSSSVLAPDTFSFTGNALSLSSDVDQNLTLPAASVAVTARSTFGTLPDVGITLNSAPGSVELYPGGSFTTSATSAGTTDANGISTLIIITGLRYTTHAVPAPASGYLAATLPTSATVTADTNWDVTLTRDLKTVSGTVSDNTGIGIEGAVVRLNGSEPDQHYSTSTNSLGQYTVQVAPGTNYQFEVAGAGGGSPTAVLPDNYDLTSSFSVSDDVVKDVTVSTVNLDLLTRDNRGAAVANVAIDFSSTGSQNGSSASSSHISRTTGADGHNQLIMLSGTNYAITATPPEHIGYIVTTASTTTPITSDAQAVVEFQNHIPLPPTATGPDTSTTPPSIDWSAVDTAALYKIYRDHVLVGTSTNLAFVDNTVTDGHHEYQVSAVSSDGYESPLSGVLAVLVDTHGPAVTDPNVVVSGDGFTLTSNIIDSLSGVRSARFIVLGGQPGGGDLSFDMSVGGGGGGSYGGSAVGIAPGAYIVIIEATDGLGNGSGDQVRVTAVVLPAKPAGLTGTTPTNATPALTWTAVPGAASYHIYRGSTQIGTSTTPGFADTDTLTDGTYSYSVAGVLSTGQEGARSDTFSVIYDTTAPTITYATTPTAPNAAGWFGAPVTITFTCADSLANVASCQSPITLSADGASQTATGTATDRAGNTATVTTTPIKIDQTKPTMGYTLSSPANAGGWNNADVTVTFTCADTLSGVATCSAPVTVGEGANQVITGTAVDNAGNTSTLDVTVSVDKTKPTIAAAILPLPNAADWNNTDAVVSFSCLDALSGIAYCSSPVHVSSETTGQTITGTAVDNAGNTQTAQTTVKLDKTAPAITYALNPAPNAAGWNSADVTVTFTCTDPGTAASGIASCTSPQTVSTQAANQTVTGTAIDRAGNITQTTATINLDKTKPTITATVSPAPNAAGWNGRANVSPTGTGNVTVSFTCTDPGPSGIGVGSGVATCSSPVTVSANTLGQVVTGTVVDLAGNTQTTQVTVKIDRTIPTVSNVSVNPGVIVFNPLVSITATAADPSGNGNVASGVIGGEYFIDTDPGEGNGNAMTYSGGQLSANTHITGLNVGPHTLYVRSLDAAGNWSLKSSTGFVFVF